MGRRCDGAMGACKALLVSLRCSAMQHGRHWRGQRSTGQRRQARSVDVAAAAAAGGSALTLCRAELPPHPPSPPLLAPGAHMSSKFLARMASLRMT
jgi:hypothetical protein